VDDDGPVANERPDSLLGRDIVVGEHQVNIENRAVGCGNLSVFAREVTHFARGRVLRVAGINLAALVGVKMGKGAIAIARAGNGLIVNVIGEGTDDSLEALEVDGTLDPGTVVGGGEFGGTSHGAISGKSGNIAGSKRYQRVISNDNDEGG
jgi:hypothetical protein